MWVRRRKLSTLSSAPEAKLTFLSVKDYLHNSTDPVKRKAYLVLKYYPKDGWLPEEIVKISKSRRHTNPELRALIKKSAEEISLCPGIKLDKTYTAFKLRTGR
jgi:hypothetical protein